MPPRSLVLLPLAVVLATVVGALAGVWLWVAVPVLAAVAVAVAAAVARDDDRRVRSVVDEVAGDLGARLEELRTERERVERVLDAIPAAVLLFSDGILAYANPAAHEQFELAPGVEDLTPLRALGAPGLAKAVEEVAETGRAVSVSVARAGRELAADARRISEQEVALVVTDLTDLQRVQDMRRDFVANASHELKTPVTGMQALADSLLMAMERDPDRARSMAGRVQGEATRMARLVRDLLDLTRLEEDAGRRDRQRVDLARMVRAQLELVETLAEERQVSVSRSGADEVSMIAIPADLRMIIGNLVTNAIQYNRPGGTVDVLVDRVGATVRLVVTDTGIGIPEADRDRVFERFYRVDKARSRAAGGTGLGLSLVRHAAQRHGGDVQVDSVLGEGSTFTVTLPVDGGAST